MSVACGWEYVVRPLKKKKKSLWLILTQTCFEMPNSPNSLETHLNETSCNFRVDCIPNVKV